MSLAGYCVVQMVKPGSAAEKFKHLNAAEIHRRTIGNVVTDDSHWSDRFEAGGTLEGMEPGQRKPGTWKLQGNEMCVIRT